MHAYVVHMRAHAADLPAAITGLRVDLLDVRLKVLSNRYLNGLDIF